MLSILTRIAGWRIVAQVLSAAGCFCARGIRLLPMLHDVGERESQVLVWSLQHEVFRVEVDQSVEQHVR